MVGVRLGIALVIPIGLTACLLLVPIDDDVSRSTGQNDASDAAPTNVADVGPNDTRDGDAPDAGGASPEPCPSTDPTLVAWFRFDEDGGTTTRDCSSRQVVATALGSTAPRFVPGRNGNAVDFAGTCFETAASTNYGFEGKPFTVAVWAWVRAFAMPDQTGRHLVSRHGSTAGWHVGSDDPDRFEIDLEYDAGKVTAEAPIPSNTWVHVASTYDPASPRMSVYVNGRLKTTTSNIPSVIGASPMLHLRLGCRSPGVNTFDGLVDDLRIYDRLLSEAELTALAR